MDLCDCEQWMDAVVRMEDPEAKKPEDWVDDKMIEDEEATKPDGWLDDEPVMVPDPGQRCCIFQQWQLLTRR